MKKTTDPLKPKGNNTAAADATRVNMNVPKATMRERMSNIPMRLQEKQNEQIRMMRERGYTPEYKSLGDGKMELTGYVPTKKFKETKTDSQGYVKQ
jgi:hypothetical protein